jgi:hypothetical protein
LSIGRHYGLKPAKCSVTAIASTMARFRLASFGLIGELAGRK